MANKGNYRLVELEDLGPAIQKLDLFNYMGEKMATNKRKRAT